MSLRGTTVFMSFSDTYCCFTRLPALASRLKRIVSEDSVAEYSFTGMDTSPKLSDSDAMERAAMVFPCRCGAIRPLEIANLPRSGDQRKRCAARPPQRVLATWL